MDNEFVISQQAYGKTVSLFTASRITVSKRWNRDPSDRRARHKTKFIEHKVNDFIDSLTTGAWETYFVASHLYGKGFQSRNRNPSIWTFKYFSKLSFLKSLVSSGLVGLLVLDLAIVVVIPLVVIVVAE